MRSSSIDCVLGFFFFFLLNFLGFYSLYKYFNPHIKLDLVNNCGFNINLDQILFVWLRSILISPFCRKPLGQWVLRLIQPKFYQFTVFNQQFHLFTKLCCITYCTNNPFDTHYSLLFTSTRPTSKFYSYPRRKLQLNMPGCR